MTSLIDVPLPDLPEQFSGENFDRRSKSVHFTNLLYEHCLKKARPFYKYSIRHLTGSPIKKSANYDSKILLVPYILQKPPVNDLILLLFRPQMILLSGGLFYEKKTLKISKRSRFFLSEGS